MLLQSTTISRLPIGSIRSGARIGVVTACVVNPHSLHIDALECRVASYGELLLLPSDILDISVKGIIINDHDVLLAPKDAVRMRSILELRYKLEGKQALVGKRKVGSVETYAVDSESFFIRKIHVKPSVLARLKSSQLIFDRTAIQEVTSKAVIFTDSSKVKEGVNVPSVA